MSTDRPAFKPNRARASLSAVPSTSSTTSLFPNKENGLSTSTLIASTSTQTGAQRKKRAQSLGGDALEGLRKRTKLEELRAEATMTFELSPSKSERRKAVSLPYFALRALQQLKNPCPRRLDDQSSNKSVQFSKTTLSISVPPAVLPSLSTLLPLPPISLASPPSRANPLDAVPRSNPSKIQLNNTMIRMKTTTTTIPTEVSIWRSQRWISQSLLIGKESEYIERVTVEESVSLPLRMFGERSSFSVQFSELLDLIPFANLQSLHTR